jgi:hypothetical protein
VAFCESHGEEAQATESLPQQKARQTKACRTEAEASEKAGREAPCGVSEGGVRNACNPTNDPEHECLLCEDEFEEWSDRRFWAVVALAVTVIFFAVLGIAYKISKLDLQPKARVESTR